MMHQCEQSIAPRKLRRDFRHGAQRQAVNDDRFTGWYRQEPRACIGQGRFTRPRKSLADVDKLDMPSQMPELGDDASVVGVAAGRGLKTSRHGEGGALHHKGASYCARATWDSESVTRMALSSRPLRPNSPARAGLARPS